MKKFDEALEILLLFLGSVLVSVLVCLFLVLLMGCTVPKIVVV